MIINYNSDVDNDIYDMKTHTPTHTPTPCAHPARPSRAPIPPRTKNTF